MIDIYNFPLLEMLLYSFAMVASPGPINIAIVSSVNQAGMRPTIPLILSAPIGTALQILLLAIGLGQIFQIYPIVQEVILYVGSAYLLHLAYKICKSSISENHKFKPVSILQGIFIGFSNPKSFIKNGLAIGLFTPLDNYIQGVIIFIVINVFVCIISNSVWAIIGKAVLLWLRSPSQKRLFNGFLAFFIVNIVIWMNSPII